MQVLHEFHPPRKANLAWLELRQIELLSCVVFVMIFMLMMLIKALGFLLVYIVNFYQQIFNRNLDMQFFDWYIVLTPFFALLIFLTLLSFKLSLKDDPVLSRQNIQQVKKQRKSQANDENVKQSVKQQSIWQTSSYLKTLSYLVRHHSIVQICMAKKSKNKLPMLSSLGIIGLICLFVPNVYFICVVGLVLVVGFVVSQSFFERDLGDLMVEQREQFQQIQQEVKNENSTEQQKKYVYLAYTAISCGASLYVCSSLYQNYSNVSLMAYGMSFLINGALDLFIVRPLGFLVISFALKFHLRTQNLIENEKLRDQIQNLPSIKISALELATTMSPRKKQSNSPTKVPRAVLKLKNNGSEDQGLMNALESLKKIKREKNQTGLITPLGKKNKVCDENNQAIEEYSLNQLFHEQQKSFTSNHLQKTPIAGFNLEQESSCNQSQVRSKRRDSELIILEFKKNDIQGEDAQSDKDPETIRQNQQDCLQNNFDEQANSELTKNKMDDQEGDPQNLKIIKLLDRKSVGHFSDDEDFNNKNDNFMTVQQKNTGLMCINQHGDQEKQIEEIDLNSPNKRRPHANHDKSMLDYDISQKKKKIRHNNSNAKKRVIKFTSGEPYLEYLPNMLSKQTNKHTKRSQPINFKSEFELFEQRPPRKSLKKIKREPKINFGRNDENQCPSAIEIEDL